MLAGANPLIHFGPAGIFNTLDGDFALRTLSYPAKNTPVARFTVDAL